MKSLCSKSKQPAMDILINCQFFVFNYQTDTLTKTLTTEHPKKIQIAVLNAIFVKIKSNKCNSSERCGNTSAYLTMVANISNEKL